MNLNFDQYIDLRGPNNPHAKITADMAHNICILLSTTLLSFEQIARKTKSTRNIVRGIASRRTWTYISQYYIFKDRRPVWLK